MSTPLSEIVWHWTSDNWCGVPSQMNWVLSSFSLSRLVFIHWRISSTHTTSRCTLLSTVSKPGFFSSGVTVACFCEAGSRPASSDELTTFVMYGSRMSKNSHTRNVGMGSRDNDLTGDYDPMHFTLHARSKGRQWGWRRNKYRRWRQTSCRVWREAY